MLTPFTRACLLGLIALALLPGRAYAQSSVAAELEGAIKDETGAALPGATIVVGNVETGVNRTIVSGPDGRYRAPALPVGSYTLTVSLDGFATVERAGLTLQVGQVATVDIVLPIARLEQSVTVTQDAPIVETGRASLGTVVSKTEINNLPINGRNFLDFSTTVAGVTGQQMSGQGSGISFNGQRSRSNNISIDGADSNGQLNGNTRLTMSQEAVREFQVVTSQFAPEFGRAGGGLVNIVSKSGTNQFTGNGFLFIRDESMDAKNAFVPGDEPKPQFERQNYGGTFGGPVVRNKTFFFGAVERIERDESDVVTIADASVAADQRGAGRPADPRRGGHLDRQRHVPRDAQDDPRLGEDRSPAQSRQRAGVPLHLRQAARGECGRGGHRRALGDRGRWRAAADGPVVPRELDEHHDVVAAQRDALPVRPPGHGAVPERRGRAPGSASPAWRRGDAA